jgi:hypothetical protein
VQAPGDRILIKIQPMWRRSTAKNMPITAAERLSNMRGRKSRRAIGSLFATSTVWRNAQKPQDLRRWETPNPDQFFYPGPTIWRATDRKVAAFRGFFALKPAQDKY